MPALPDHCRTLAALFPRRPRRLGGPPDPWFGCGRVQQTQQPLAGIVSVLLLAAKAAGSDDKHPLARDAPAGEAQEADAHRLGQRR